ncbi:hypothetical protein CSA56_03395 [candidate division KSB3 bacterium]|uniref:Bacterial type II secretion system protein E domain-containing protein n=1 Tax=candidate division KSB3 bacterium TaxID=2044937 RepID=A0A2G6KJ06_9BACT|nr:MAG: hypothetical protein CSA56_03395 [candidate division KSB3 bacterium]
MKEKLFKLLHDEQVITEEQYQQALQRSETFGESAEQVLGRMGILSEEQLLEFLGRKFRMPLADWNDYIPDQRALNLISEDVALKYVVFPLFIEQGKRQGKMTLAIANPSNVSVADDIAFMTGCTIKTCIASARAIREAIHLYYPGKVRSPEEAGAQAETGKRAPNQDFTRSGSGEINALLSNILQEVEGEAEEQIEGISGADREHPSIRFLLELLQKTAKYGVTEIHIDPYGHQEYRIRLRRHGSLHEHTRIPAQLGEGLATRLQKILQQADRNVLQKTESTGRHGRFSTILNGANSLDIAANFYPTPFGKKIYLRLQKDAELRTFQHLGMPEKSLKTLNRSLAKPQGILLLVSPPGEGKTTTFYALLRKLAQAGNHVLALEEVDERSVPDIPQIPYSPETSFQEWCSTISYYAPHVLGLGAVEKPSMKRLAFEFASSSLVIVTLTAKSLGDGVCSFISSLFDELDMCCSTEALSYLLDSMNGIVVQRLARTICPNCREQHALSESDHEWLQQFAGVKAEDGDAVSSAGKGCAECMETGYNGQIALFEVLKIDKVLKNLLLQHYPSCVSPVRNFYTEMSPETFKHQLLQLFRNRVTSLAEIRRMAL